MFLVTSEGRNTNHHRRGADSWKGVCCSWEAGLQKCDGLLFSPHGLDAYLCSYQDAQHRPQGGALGDAAGVGNATSGSLTDRLTREHRMTADEARLILNLKREDGAENILRVRLFSACILLCAHISPVSITSTSSKLIHHLHLPKNPSLAVKSRNTTRIISNRRLYVRRRG